MEQWNSEILPAQASSRRTDSTPGGGGILMPAGNLDRALAIYTGPPDVTSRGARTVG